MRGQPSGELPHPLDGSELRRVRWQEQQCQDAPVPAQQRGQQDGVVVSGVVQHDDHPLAMRTMSQQLPEKGVEGSRIEYRAHRADEFSGAQADGAEAGHGFSSGCVLQHRILDLGRHPHASARAVLLEMAFVQAPELNVGALGEPAQFF